MDMVVNHAAKISQMFGGKVEVPMVIRTPGGAGAQLTAQHSQSLEVWFAHTPGLKVVAPAKPADAYGLLKTAIRDDDPVLFIENLVLYNLTGPLPSATSGNGDGARPDRPGAGRARGRRPDAGRALLHRAPLPDGRRPALPGGRRGRGRRPALAAAARRRDGGRVGAEDEPGAGRGGGLGDLRRRRRARGAHPRRCFDDLDAPVERVGGAEVPMPYAKPLELAAMPLEDKIEAAARRLLRECGML